MFVEHKAPFTPTARPEPLLQRMSEKTCQQIVLSDHLDQGLGELQASIFSARLIGSLPNAIVRRGRALGNHKPDIEFIVQSLERARSISYLATMTPLGVIHHIMHVI